MRVIFTLHAIYLCDLRILVCTCGQGELLEGHFESLVLKFKKAIKCLWFGLCCVNHWAISAQQFIGLTGVSFKEEERGSLS